MEKEVRTALYWVGGYLLGSVLLAVLVGAFILAMGAWS